MAKPKATPTVDITPPALLFQFPEGIERKPIKMTYGLEMDIRRMLPDPKTAMELLLGDPITQDYILRRCLTEKNKMITNFDDLIAEDEFEDLSSETRDDILMWAGEHALYFFAKRTMGVANLGVRLEELLPALLPEQLQSGLKDLASTTPSAGPSES
jgi:hypothetical protein